MGCSGAGQQKRARKAMQRLQADRSRRREGKVDWFESGQYKGRKAIQCKR